MGLRANRLKKEVAQRGRVIDIALPALVLFGGVLPGLQLGVGRGEVLPMVFAALGIITAVPQLLN